MSDPDARSSGFLRPAQTSFFWVNFFIRRQCPCLRAKSLRDWDACCSRPSIVEPGKTVCSCNMDLSIDPQASLAMPKLNTCSKSPTIIASSKPKRQEYGGAVAQGTPVRYVPRQAASGLISVKHMARFAAPFEAWHSQQICRAASGQFCVLNSDKTEQR